ncbi:hypothetical protein N9S00_07060 [Luminiphilus sp.]|nr:hypothetical protein [Luminiphilus sp.]
MLPINDLYELEIRVAIYPGAFDLASRVRQVIALAPSGEYVYADDDVEYEVERLESDTPTPDDADALDESLALYYGPRDVDGLQALFLSNEGIFKSVQEMINKHRDEGLQALELYDLIAGVDAGD